MLLPCDNHLYNFNLNIKTEPTEKKQNKKTTPRQLAKKHKEESVTENKEMMEKFLVREKVTKSKKRERRPESR